MKRQHFLKFGFFAYCGVMLWLLFIRSRGVAVTDYWAQLSQRISLVPLSSIGSMLRTLWRYPQPEVLRIVVYNLGGNIVMFVPLGFFLPALWPKFRKFGRCMAAVAGIMSIVELIQLLTLRGILDTDDLLLNLTGAAIGFWIYQKSKR